MTDAAASLDPISHPDNIGEESVGSKRKGHRQEDETWQMFDKIPLSKEKAALLHRANDASCRACHTRVIGQPAKLKTHLTSCKEAATDVQLRAYTDWLRLPSLPAVALLPSRSQITLFTNMWTK